MKSVSNPDEEAEQGGGGIKGGKTLGGQEDSRRHPTRRGENERWNRSLRSRQIDRSLDELRTIHFSPPKDGHENQQSFHML